MVYVQINIFTFCLRVGCTTGGKLFLDFILIELFSLSGSEPWSSNLFRVTPNNLRYLNATN